MLINERELTYKDFAELRGRIKRLTWYGYERKARTRTYIFRTTNGVFIRHLTPTNAKAPAAAV